MSNPVIATVEGSVGILRLNRPEQLNSLNLEMVRELARVLHRWRGDPKIRAVILESSSEKAFCAGGDVKKIAELALIDRRAALQYAKDFFAAEYALDHAIHQFPKPVIVFARGLVLGGGLGLALGAAERIVSESTKMAMPEMRIGFFPDVGASYVLSRLPSRLGFFIALVGYRVGPGDAVALGLATQFIPDAELTGFRHDLITAQWTGDAARDRKLASRIARDWAEPAPRGELEDRAGALAQFLEQDSLEKIVEDLNVQGFPFQGSPTSARVTFEQFERASKMTLAECFQQDLSLALRFCEQSDFVEGVRCALIDKGGTPRWNPSHFDEVRLENYFDN